MTYLVKADGHSRPIIIFMAMLMAIFTGGIVKASLADASILASQPSAQCSILSSKTPHAPSNAANCRSTNPDLKIYFENDGDTSECTFNLTFNWGDGTPPENIPNSPGGPSGLQFITSYTYTNPGVYTIQVTGSVASGDCTFTGGDVQFSYILSTTPYPQGPPISAQTMLSRGADWVAAQVPYSNSTDYSDLYGTYREDCSGFVSMMWDLDYSLSTADLASPSVTTKVTAGLDGIQPGDIILKPKTKKAHGHVFLFAGWVNSAHTMATVIEETSETSHTPYAVMKNVPPKIFVGFTVYSYNNEAAASPNGTPSQDGARAPGIGRQADSRAITASRGQ
jgi:hypothetical protein